MRPAVAAQFTVIPLGYNRDNLWISLVNREICTKNIFVDRLKLQTKQTEAVEVQKSRGKHSVRQKAL